MSRTTDGFDAKSEAGRSLSLARLGRYEEAKFAAAAAERNPSHATLALTYLKLGASRNAKPPAEVGYRWYWADGPPFSYRWQLQVCDFVLRTLDSAVPQLPRFNYLDHDSIEYETALWRRVVGH
jgi:hypothetical protein